MGYHKGQVTQKSEKIDRIIKLRFRQKVLKLKRECTRLSLNLLLYNRANNDAICVLSDSEFELAETKQNCSERNENYFLNPTAYELLLENSKYDWV